MFELKQVKVRIGVFEPDSNGQVIDGSTSDENRPKAYGLGTNFTGVLSEMGAQEPLIEIFRYVFLNGKLKASRYCYSKWMYWNFIDKIERIRLVTFEDMFESLTPEEKELVVWNLDLIAGEMNWDR